MMNNIKLTTKRSG